MIFFKLNIIHKYNEIYKILLFIISISLLVWIFPREATFKYEFKSGKYWMHDDLIASYDFPIIKNQSEMSIEKNQIIKNAPFYFVHDTKLSNQIKDRFKENLNLLKNEMTDNQMRKELLRLIMLLKINHLILSYFT